LIQTHQWHWRNCQAHQLQHWWWGQTICKGMLHLGFRMWHPPSTFQTRCCHCLSSLATLQIYHHLCESFTVNRTQLPLVLADSYTDYKSQGCTLQWAIVDLDSVRSLQGSYVMLSCVKSLKGIAVAIPLSSLPSPGTLSWSFSFCDLQVLSDLWAVCWFLNHSLTELG
jgi:hypothetical protein